MREYGVILLALFHAALLAAAPVGEESGDLVRFENVQNENGYRFSYETIGGQTGEEAGVFDAKSGVLRASGWYSFRTPSGGTYRVDFVADENGYRATAYTKIRDQEPAHAIAFSAPVVTPASVKDTTVPLSETLLKSLVGIG